MAANLIIDRIPPDMHVDEKGNIVWTPRLIDFNAAAYTRGHVVTADEFNTELIKQTYQGNYNTDTISVLIGLYNALKVDVTGKADTANTNAATALSRVNIAEANSIEALGTANTALSTSEDALADVQAAVSASTEAITIAKNTINIAETAKALSEDASDKADAAVLDAEEAMRIAEGADAVAIGAEDIANEAKQIAEAANNTSNTANTNASTAVNTANAASQTANEAKSTASTAAYSAGNAVTTANTANTNASAAFNTANTANTTSATALTKANEAVTTANTAVTTANAAKEESANAINVADTASAKVEQAVLDINEAKAVAEEAAASVADKASTSYVTEVLKAYYTSGEVDDLLASVEVDLSDYYTKEETYSAKEIDNKISNVEVDLSGYYTKTETDNIATQTLNSAKGYTNTKIAELIDSAPETLDTFKEIADAFAEDQAILDTLNSAIGNKASTSDLANYLPLSAGSGKKLTGALLSSQNIILDNTKGFQIRNTDGTAIDMLRFNASNQIIMGSSSTKYDMVSYCNIRPSSLAVDLGNSGNPWTNIYGTTIYQNGKQVANKEDIPDTSGLAKTTDLENYLSLKNGGTVSGSVTLSDATISKANVSGLTINGTPKFASNEQFTIAPRVLVTDLNGWCGYITPANFKKDLGIASYSLDGTTLTITL